MARSRFLLIIGVAAVGPSPPAAGRRLSWPVMPEGDALHRAARRLQPLVGERVEVETPHPRARSDGCRAARRPAPALRRGGRQEPAAHLRGRLVLRSHLRMSGRWTLVPRGVRPARPPWLVLRGAAPRGACRGTARCSSSTPATSGRLGPDILAAVPAVDRMVANLAGASLRPRRRRRAARPAASSPGSGTSGRPRRSGRRSSPRGGRSARRATTSSTPCFEAAARPDARLARGRRRDEPRLPTRRSPVPTLRRDDPLARPGRRQPDRRTGAPAASADPALDSGAAGRPGRSRRR